MDERVVLLTGAGSGIGAVTALAFADHGWTVYATDVETPLPDAVQTRCHTLELDMTDPEQCRAGSSGGPAGSRPPLPTGSGGGSAA